LGIRAYDNVSRIVDREVTFAPGIDEIELLGVHDLPWLGGVVLAGAAVAGDFRI
jgi:hypothetical protein